MKVGDLVRKKYRQYHMPTAVSFKSGSVHIVTETRINLPDECVWIKVLAHGVSVGWIHEDDWEIVNESR